jgi:hypothetical protein
MELGLRDSAVIASHLVADCGTAQLALGTGWI